MHGLLSLEDTVLAKTSRRLDDEAISQPPASILALKYQKNALAPISRLPPEVLCRIFFLYKEGGKLRYISNKSAPFKCRWVKVTHVCSHWRRVTLNWPNFWVDPPLENFRWVEEMLERSKDAGLEIRIELGMISTHAIAPSLKLVLQHSSRIRRLTVDIHDLSAWNNVQKALPKFAPRLEYFCMSDRSRGLDLDNESHAYPIASLSEAVFCKTERLRDLVLFRCNPNWNSHPSLLHSLGHLTLYRLPFKSRPSGRQFMDALVEMPNLRILHITESLPVEQTWDYCQIHFASLQSLRVHSTYIEAETFFRCVTFPSTAIVDIECTVDQASSSGLNVSAVISYLSRSYTDTISDTAFHTLIYGTSFLAENEVRLKLSTAVLMDEQIIRYTTIAGDLNLVFKLTTASLEQYNAILINNILNGPLPLHDVTIHIDLSWKFCTNILANTLGILPQVRSIIVGREAGGLFLELLQLGPYMEEAGFTGPAEKLYFPNLYSIRLGGVKFRKLVSSEVREDPTTISVESLKNCLIQRAESGAKIKKLTLRYCRQLEECDVDSLTGVADEIDWDQHELFDDSEAEYSTTYEEEDSSEEDY